MAKRKAQEIHALFASQVGAYAIATPVNIEAVIEYCKSSNLRRVLELGGGIGTLTYTVLSESEANVEVYEDNPYCREQLVKNIGQWRDRVKVIASYDVLPSAVFYDLVIIDGPDCDDLLERDRKTRNVLSSLRDIDCFFIEGSRYSQRRIAQRVMSNLNTYTLDRVRGRKVAELGLVKGGLFIRKKGTAEEGVRKLGYLFWLLYDTCDFLDPRRRQKIARRMLNPSKTIMRLWRKVVNFFKKT